MAEKVLKNCDMGESFGSWEMGNDEKMMPYIDLANIACGFHAGDASTMKKTVEMALSSNVSIGAHPGYPDIQGFGRRSMQMGHDEITDMLWYQMGALRGITKALGGQLNHVKPHGALYNDMMKDETLLHTIMAAVAKYDDQLLLIIQSTKDWQKHQEAARAMGVQLCFEAFTDRGYQKNGLLLPRNQPGALLSIQEAIAQAKEILTRQQVKTEDGAILQLKVDTLCIHGDGDNALEIARALAGI